jgi:hypothetical protein
MVKLVLAMLIVTALLCVGMPARGDYYIIIHVQDGTSAPVSYADPQACMPGVAAYSQPYGYANASNYGYGWNGATALRTSYIDYGARQGPMVTRQRTVQRYVGTCGPFGCR